MKRSDVVDETASATNAAGAFRRDSSAKQWIFDIGTKILVAGKTHFYIIKLSDGTAIGFQFGLRWRGKRGAGRPAPRAVREPFGSRQALELVPVYNI